MKNTRTSVNIWNGSRKIAPKDEYSVIGFVDSGLFETCFFSRWAVVVDVCKSFIFAASTWKCLASRMIVVCRLADVACQ